MSSPSESSTATKIRIQHADGRAEERTLDAGIHGVGREADITIDDPGVSALHGEIEVRPDAVVFTDRGSTNGTFDAAGQRLSAPYTLLAQHPIRLGGATITLLRKAPAAGRTMVMPVGTSVPAPLMSPGPASVPATEDGNATLRGTVIKVPDGSPGLLVAGGSQYPFELTGLWKSPVAPAVNMTVTVIVDARGALASITAVDAQELAKERLNQFGSAAQEHGKQAAGLATQALGGIVARMGKLDFGVALAVLIAWFFLPIASVQFIVSTSWTFWESLALDLGNPLNNPGSHGLGSMLGLLAVAAPFASPYLRHPRAHLLLAAPAAFLGLFVLRLVWSMRGLLSDDPMTQVAGAVVANVFSALSPGLGLFVLPIAAGFLAVRALRGAGHAGLESTSSGPGFLRGRGVLIGAGLGALLVLGLGVLGARALFGDKWVDAPMVCQEARSRLQMLNIYGSTDVAADLEKFRAQAAQRGFPEQQVAQLRSAFDVAVAAQAQLTCSAAGKSYAGAWECTSAHQRVTCK